MIEIFNFIWLVIFLGLNTIAAIIGFFLLITGIIPFTIETDLEEDE